MIAAIIIFFVAMIAKLNLDVWLYQSRKTNHHTWGPAAVLIALGVCTLLAGWMSASMWLFNWWAMFDSLYGVLIGQGWLYIGETAKLDRLQRRYHAIIWIKYIGAVTSIIIFICLQSNK